MSFLQLERIAVEIQDPNATTRSSPPDGTDVWLDTPGARFAFQHYTTTTVNGVSHLAIAGGGSTALAHLDPTQPYWCVWGSGIGSVSSGWDPKGSFGYPLPVSWQRSGGRTTLVLPNTVTVVARTFNLSTTVSDAQVASYVSEASTYYARVHIQLSQDPQPLPSGVSAPWALFKDPPQAGPMFVGPISGNSITSASPQPSFGRAPWAPSAHADRTVTVIYMESFARDRSVGGRTFPRGVAGAAPFRDLFGEQFHTAPGGVVFINQHGTAATNSLAHELGHALLSVNGMGYSLLEPHHLEAPLKALMHRLGVPAALPFYPRGSHARTGDGYDDIASDTHYSGGSDDGSQRNLMSVYGGMLLLPWQVAVLRTSHECTHQG